MAEFNRKELKAIFEAADIEVPKDVLGQLCTLHAESCDGMGETIKDLKRDLRAAEQARDEALEKAPKDGEETVKKADYDDLKTEFDTYKNGIEEKNAQAEKVKAAREFFKSKGMSETAVEIAVRGSSAEIGALELEDGKIKDTTALDTLCDGIYKGMVGEIEEHGANTANPNSNRGGEMTKADIAKIKDPEERRAAIAENMDIFEKKGTD